MEKFHNAGKYKIISQNREIMTAIVPRFSSMHWSVLLLLVSLRESGLRDGDNGQRRLRVPCVFMNADFTPFVNQVGDFVGTASK